MDLPPDSIISSCMCVCVYVFLLDALLISSLPQASDRGDRTAAVSRESSSLLPFVSHWDFLQVNGT